MTNAKYIGWKFVLRRNCYNLLIFRFVSWKGLEKWLTKSELPVEEMVIYYSKYEYINYAKINYLKTLLVTN